MPIANRLAPIFALALATLVGVPAAAAALPVGDMNVPGLPLHTVSDGADCGWFTIVASSRNRSGVARAANRAGGRVIDTNAVPEFTPGLYAAVLGPTSKDNARAERRSLRIIGFSDAYVKFGCQDY